MSSFAYGLGFSKAQRRRLLGSVLAPPPVGPTLTPNVMTASSFWNPTSKKNGQDTGLNGAAAMTASSVQAGSGYPEMCVVGTTYTPLQCISSDADSDAKYIMFWVTGDTALCGARTLEINFEGTTRTFDMAADVQYDAAKNRFGVPVAFRPRAGFSGLARFRAKGLVQNGFERVIQGDLWFNYPGTANYFDRDANAIYVAGANYNGSGTAGTRTASAGTSADPNDTVQRAIQFAHDAAGGREGCYIYIRGDVADPSAPFTRPTTTLPCEVRPWPGIAANQARYGGQGRHAGKINLTNNKVVFQGLTIASDGILGFETNVNHEIGFRSCFFEGTVDGGDDIYGWPKGLLVGSGGVNSQEWLRITPGSDGFLEDCTGTLYAPTGIRRWINCAMAVGWDTFYGAQNSGGRNTGFNYWNVKAFTPPGRQAKARFHQPEQLTVATVSYDSVNGWTKITWQEDGVTANVQGNSFETHVVFLTGGRAGVEYFGGQGTTTAWPSGPLTNCAAIRGSAAVGSFPDIDTLYIKGVDLTGQVAAGDLFRAFNIPHKDSMQTNSTSDTQGFIEHGYFQNYTIVSDDPQPALIQQNSPFNTTGITLSVTGSTATFSSAITAKAGHFIQVRSGGNIYKYAMITADVTASTTAPLDRADLNGTVSATWALGRPVKDFVFENYIVDKTDPAPYLMQFQSPVINMVFLNATLIRPSSTNQFVHLSDQASGFGARGLVFRDCILGTAKAVSGTPPTSGISFDSNHYWVTPTVTDAGASLGAPTFNSMGDHLSGYLPTSANVAAISRVLVPRDAYGNVRAIGNKRGAVVA